MKTEEIVRLLQGALRLKQNDKRVRGLSRAGQPNARYWQETGNDYLFPVDRNEDVAGLKLLERYGRVEIDHDNNFASWIAGDYRVWYSTVWGWGIQFQNREIYCSSDPNYTDEEGEIIIPLATMRVNVNN